MTALLLPPAHVGHPDAGSALAWLLPLLVLVSGHAAYLLGVVGHRRRRGSRWPPWRTASCSLGVGLVAVALSPVVATAAHDPRGHMVQHLLLGMFAPIALVLAAPVSLLLGATSPQTGRRVSGVLRHPVVHVVSHPASAALLHVGSLYVLYLTPLYALTTQHELVHHALHVHFLAAGCLFAWAVAGPDPSPRRPRLATRVSVLVLAAGAHSYLGKLLYARAGDLPPGAGHEAAGMEAAAQLMYYGGDVAEVALAAALFAGWYRRRTPVRQAAQGGVDVRRRGVQPWR